MGRLETSRAATVRSEDLAEAGRRQVVDWIIGGMLCLLIDIGYSTGLLEVMVGTDAPLAAFEIAAEAGLDERNVREWLFAMAAAGVVQYRATDESYLLKDAFRGSFSDHAVANMAPRAQAIRVLGAHATTVAAGFRTGKGVPYSVYRPGFTELMDRMNRSRYDALLLSGYLDRVEGLVESLEEGVSVCDIGCGAGHVVNLMARAFPKSTFLGVDIAVDAIAAADREADSYGVTNARFEVGDVSRLTSGPFEVITAFDAIHDQAAPQEVLARAHDALAPGGVLLVVDIDSSSNLEQNLANPMAPYVYGISVLHCLQVSLAEGGPGLGAGWGRERAEAMFRAAGFAQIETMPAPKEDPLNVIYVCR